MLVVHDSDSRAVLRRTPIEMPDRASPRILAVADRGVFLDDNHNRIPTSDSLRRYDVDSGVLEPVDQADVAAARRAVTHALVVGPSAEHGRLLHWEGDGSTTNSVESLTVTDDARLDELIDPHTGEDVEMRLPAVYAFRQVWFVQWVDDDRFALIPDFPAMAGDLLVCRISEGRCDVLLDQSARRTAPLLPGDNSPGAEHALIREMRSVREERSGR